MTPLPHPTTPATLISRLCSNPVRLRWALALLVVVAALSAALVQRSAAAVTRDRLTTALRATVLILTLDRNNEVIGNGSGTVLDAARGLLLTNFHVTGDVDTGRLYNPEGLTVVGVMPTDLRGAPVLKYVAQVIKADVDLDLALLQIIAPLEDLQAQLPANLGLVQIAVGDSDELMIGDEISVLGYPGLGGTTVTFTQGVISGFLDEDNDGEYEWLKTDTEINPGNSGGLAINSNGEFIGIPTIARSGSEVTGKLSLVRMGNVARRFYAGATIESGPATGPRIQGIQFGEAINRKNQILNPATSFPAGITDLYAAYEFGDFIDGAPFEVNWYRDGEKVANEGYTWDEGPSGASMALIYDDNGLEAGFYEVELIYDGRVLARSGASVGQEQAAAAGGSFGAITFSEDTDTNNEPVRAGDAFADITEVFATFDYAGMRDGVEWETQWSYGGEIVAGSTQAWNGGASGRYSVSLSNGGDPLPTGDYRLDLYLGDRLAQGAGFAITAQTAPAAGIEITGVVHDRDNSQRTIEGALILFLRPGVSFDQWAADDYPEDAIHASATSARRGLYRLDTALTAGERYTVVVIHDDYQPIIVDDFEIPADASSPFELDIPMLRN